MIQFDDLDTGQPGVTGRYLSQSQGREALVRGAGALCLTRDSRGASLEDRCPDIYDRLQDYGALCRNRLREEMQIEFTIHHGHLHILDAIRVRRSSRAAVQIAVSLAADAIISESEAVLRVQPGALLDVLHRQVDPEASVEVLCTGIAASPGAATGQAVFTAAATQACAAREQPCILVRRETHPGDVNGMHAAAGILTERGGAASHAAAIARGIGRPCVVGASLVEIDIRAHRLTTAEGRVIAEGDVVTVDGSSGRILVGSAPLLEPALDEAFQTLLGWADERRDIGIRAKCDTPADARVADGFRGIGLCRTEHMFFQGDRLTVMREMIFAERAIDRVAALKRLSPVQDADFREFLKIMAGRPVCVRTLDPPLYEFLPQDRAGLVDLAAALDLPLSSVDLRVQSLTETNPMLGMRGVRLGIAIPQIYEMQASGP